MKLKKPTPPEKPATTKNTALPISELAQDALARLKQNHGVNRTFAIERGVVIGLVPILWATKR
jgi:hypothetical protein